MLCNDCIKNILNNLTQEEILLLQSLYKEKRINTQTAIEKNKLLTLGKNLSQYKLNSIIDRLTLINFVIRTSSFPAKYYIGEDGISSLKIYKEQLKILLK